MNINSRVSAVIGYIPIIGWIYVLLLRRDDDFARFHAKQSIGLVLFLIAVFVAWVIVAYIIALVPYLAVLSAALFSLVIAFWLYGALMLIAGILQALRSQSDPLPIFGRWAARLPL